jgi:hypothetical protein
MILKNNNINILNIILFYLYVKLFLKNINNKKLY